MTYLEDFSLNAHFNVIKLLLNGIITRIEKSLWLVLCIGLCCSCGTCLAGKMLVVRTRAVWSSPSWARDIPRGLGGDP